MGASAMVEKGALCILIVEDEFIIALGLQTLLNDLGYENVYHAENLLRAAELLDSVNPDFAVLDVNIGHSLVFPFAAELAARKVPFVFSTALSRETLPVEWQGCVVLSKPLERRALDSAIKSLDLCGTGTAARVAPAAYVQRQPTAENYANVPVLLEGDMSAPVVPPSPLRFEESSGHPSEEAAGATGEMNPSINITDISKGEAKAGEP
jgi:DNA-binding response OmpR family regulator